MILEGKLAKTANSKIGMIEPRSGITTDARQGFSLARIVVKPDQHRVVPLRVINMSQTPIELIAGENIADFCHLVESCSKVPAAQKPDVCGAVQRDWSKTFLGKVNAVIDSTLTYEARSGKSLGTRLLSHVKTKSVYNVSCIQVFRCFRRQIRSQSSHKASTAALTRRP
jgi:hypothetical protein